MQKSRIFMVLFGRIGGRDILAGPLGGITGAGLADGGVAYPASRGVSPARRIGTRDSGAQPQDPRPDRLSGAAPGPAGQARNPCRGLLWGDSPDVQARQSLRQALLSLRKTLGDGAADAIDADDETVTLRGEAVETDVAAFERGVAEGRLGDAAVAYRGDLMQEPAARSDTFNAWLAQERTRLQDLACTTLEAHGEQLMRDGHADTAVQVGRQLHALDPWRESGTRLLMRAYAQAGRRAEALHHYRTVAESLRQELDAEPDAATTRLYEEIREGSGPPLPEPDAEQPAPPKPTDIVEPSSATPAKRKPWAAVAAVAVSVVVGWVVWSTHGPAPPSGPETPARGTASVPATDKPSIAVLPFANMSGDPDQEYFADGITKDIMTGLSRFGYFFVISRNSTFSYKGTAIRVSTVAQELGVRYVLEGSVRKTDERIRITAQLIDAEADKHIWAETYDRALKDMFQVQDEISKSIVTAVAPEYFSAELKRARRTDTPNLEAWDAFMRGYWHYLRYTKDDNAKAHQLLQRAVELDPNRANYHAVLAVVHMIDGLYGWSESREDSMRKALQIAEHGLTLDDRDAQVIRVPGVIHFFSRNYDAARGYYERAVAANPHEAENHALLGATFGVAGEYEAALASFETAMRLSPRDVHIATWYNYLAIAAFVVGRDAEAAEWSRKTIQANPTFPGGYRSLAASAGNLGLVDEARSAREKSQDLLPHLTLAQLRESLPYFKDPKTMERYLDGLRKAGLPEGGTD